MQRVLKTVLLAAILGMSSHAVALNIPKAPVIPFMKSQLPAPDYARHESWAAFPGHPSNVEKTPAGVEKGNPENAKVDVFFIHPTTFMSIITSNARFDETGLTKASLELAVLRYEAGVFNACCRIYAPRYRQASLKRIIGSDASAIKSTSLAYSDVLRAFEYYITHENKGRPFILAGHSQGSIHAVRLLQERIIGTPLQKRMVAAYVLGTALPAAIEQKGLPICNSPTMTRCVIGWNTVAVGHNDSRRKEKALVWWEDRYQPIGGRPLVCVNPLNWKKDGSALASENIGSVYSEGPRAMPAPVAHATGAWCKNGLLGINLRPDQKGHFKDILSMFGNYHDFDYGMFYMNIRANVAERIDEYFRNHPSGGPT